MRRLLDFTQITPHEHIYKDDKRFHKITGFTFTPDTVYQPFQSNEMFQWSYVQEIFLELKVQHRANRAGLTFSCIGPEGSELENPIALKNSDKLQRDFSMYVERGHLFVIGSFFFDPLSGYWVYKSVKFDKQVPFHFSKVLSTLEVMSVRVLLSELGYCREYDC
jgi:hypothetical protein